MMIWLARFLSSELAKSSLSKPTSPVMVIGDKSEAQMFRWDPKKLAMAFNQIGRDFPTFNDAAGVVILFVKSGAEHGSMPAFIIAS
jgi:hypothetical protein